MANSKTIEIRQKHRRRRRAAKNKLDLCMAGKMEPDALPELAKRYLRRRLRVTKRG